MSDDAVVGQQHDPGSRSRDRRPTIAGAPVSAAGEFTLGREGVVPRTLLARRRDTSFPIAMKSPPDLHQGESDSAAASRNRTGVRSRTTPRRSPGRDPALGQASRVVAQVAPPPAHRTPVVSRAHHPPSRGGVLQLADRDPLTWRSRFSCPVSRSAAGAVYASGPGRRHPVLLPCDMCKIDVLAQVPVLIIHVSMCAGSAPLMSCQVTPSDISTSRPPIAKEAAVWQRPGRPVPPGRHRDPGPKSRAIQERRRSAVAQGVSSVLPVYVGRGRRLVRRRRQRLIDFGSGIAVTNVGSADPRVVERAAEQLGRFTAPSW